nr:uncharacterized protein LOC113735449 [Coffea arabica]
MSRSHRETKGRLSLSSDDVGRSIGQQLLYCTTITFFSNQCSKFVGVAGVLEDYIDSIWIIKVFRSFGCALPFILVSILLATGPKAFLMALALPLGQSTFSFAIQKMRGGKDKRPKRKTKTKSRSYPRSSRTVKRVEKNAPTFGGWDELDGLSEFDIGSSSSSGQSVGKSKNSPPENGRLSMRTEKSDTPLLLRLLIAVFPFLAKML